MGGINTELNVKLSKQMLPILEGALDEAPPSDVIAAMCFALVATIGWQSQPADRRLALRAIRQFTNVAVEIGLKASDGAGDPQDSTSSVIPFKR